MYLVILFSNQDHVLTFFLYIFVMLKFAFINLLFMFFIITMFLSSLFTFFFFIMFS
jgi:hypothetical protein